jgi:DNA repair exonuclease SbcCD ATPase subunit
MSIRNQTLTLPDKGLIFVFGTQAGSNFESVGSGKTSFGEALCMAVTGYHNRFSSVGHYSRNEKGDMYIRVDGKLGPDTLTVETGYKCKELSKTGEGLRFSLGSNQISRSHVDLTRAELLKTLSIEPHVTPWSIFIDGDNLDFNKLSQVQSTDVLMAVLGQPSWSEAHIKAKKTLNQLNMDLTEKMAAKATVTSLVSSVETSIGTSRTRIRLAQEAFDSQKVLLAQRLASITAEIESINEKIQDREATRKAHKREIVAIENEHAGEFKRLESQDLKQRGVLATLRKDHDAELAKMQHANSEFRRHTKVLEDLQKRPTKCPTCRKDWDMGPSAEQISSATSNVELAKALLDTRMAELDEALLALNKQTAVVDNIQSEKFKLNVSGQVKAISAKLDVLDNLDRQDYRTLSTLGVEKAKAEAGPNDNHILELNAALNEKQATLEEHRTALEGLTCEIGELAELAKIVEYWVSAFSPTGIPNIVLTRSLAPLNHVSSALSHRMSGGALDIQYSTSKEMASGQEKSLLNIKVRNKHGASRINGNSKGERGLVNLITAETITEIGRVSQRIGFRWYDEVIKNEDSKVRRNVMSYLKDTANRLGILIFVVDHDPETSSYADYTLVANKSASDETTFSWRT